VNTYSLGVFYGKCYIFRCFNYFYYDEKIVNLSSLVIKKLDIFYFLKWQIIFIIEFRILVVFIITTYLLRRFLYANEYLILVL